MSWQARLPVRDSQRWGFARKRPSPGTVLMPTNETSFLKTWWRRRWCSSHDSVYNCDRPRMKPQDLKRDGKVLKVIQDEFLVFQCDEHINAEFRFARIPPL